MRIATVGFAVIAAFAAVVPAAVRAAPTGGPRVTQSFDADWRFEKGDAPGAETPDFADSSWRTVPVPHDWAIEGAFDAGAPEGGAGAFLPTGIGWYRKRFMLPHSDAGKRVRVEFDGVMANSDVWINGFALGHRPSGYVSFSDDLTGHLRFGGAANVLAVRADDSAQPASRWYAGAGIYRHVRLVVTDPVHLAPDGVYVTTPSVAANAATVRVRSEVVNDSPGGQNITVETTLIAPDGHALPPVASPTLTVAAGAAGVVTQEIAVSRPDLWDLDHPRLYRAVTRVRASNGVRDAVSTAFGIRSARCDAATGFSLNGVNLKLKGVCLHGDMGGLGVAVPLSAWQRRLTALKAVGCNAIRTSHNPPSPEFLDLCDRMGFLVMDEMFDCWTVAKTPYDYHLYFREWSQRDTRDTVRRDRNHPSVVLYSAGNEIHDTPKAALAKSILSGLLTVFHENDPTRPVTMALFRPNASGDYTNGLADMLDVVGQNYREPEILAAHAQKPARKIVGTENGKERAAWLAVRDNAFHSGQFLWTGFDYLGESRRWPAIGSGSGLFDRIGTPHSAGLERQALWSAAPVVHLVRRVAAARAIPSDPGFVALQQRESALADWTPADTSPHTETVEVYSNCAQVDLQLNGKSLGVQPRAADERPRVWKVPFAPGALTALGSDGGAVTARETLRTAGAPAKILLTADRDTLTPTFDDVDYVTATVVDADGVPVPTAADTVTFTLTGPGAIAAVDNGDNAGHESFRGNVRSVFGGRCVAILRATAPTGEIVVRASAPGRADGTLTLHARPVAEENP
jgi:beta-galactosidase